MMMAAPYSMPRPFLYNSACLLPADYALHVGLTAAAQLSGQFPVTRYLIAAAGHRQ